MKRLFTAIHPLPDPEFLIRFRELRAAMRWHRMKWVEEENLHITIHFFGETEEQKIPQINDLLQSEAGSQTVVSFRYRGLGIFGSSYQPKVIWAGIEPYEEVSLMISKVKEDLVQIGFSTDRQNPVPHLTLGRVRSIQDHRNFQNTIDRFQSISSREMIVRELILFESILSRSGPEYHVIQSFPFKQ